jgi:hypothetical protein
MIQNAGRQPETGVLSAVMGVVALIVGSLIGLLWVYYSSLTFFLDAEFTQVYASQYGSGVRPTENAEPLGIKRKRETPLPERRSANVITHW